MSIYAMVAVDQYAEMGEDGYYITYQNVYNGSVTLHTNATVSSYTPRGQTYGFEYYGCFSRSFYTL